MGTNAFQSNAFQQTVGLVAFQEATTSQIIVGGKSRHEEGIKQLYRHIAAVNLGRKGGLAYAASRSR